MYVGVEDADDLDAEFDAAGAGQSRMAQDTDYEMRELIHIDPDGNLILFGSRLAEPARRPLHECMTRTHRRPIPVRSVTMTP